MSRIKDYAIKCMRDEAQAILNLIPLLDDNFDKAVELIHHCKGRLIVTGVGKSGHIGAKIAATLASTGTRSPENIFPGMIPPFANFGIDAKAAIMLPIAPMAVIHPITGVEAAEAAPCAIAVALLAS